MRDLIFGLIGGTALLMYGVDMMGEGLEKISGPMMKRILATLTGRLWQALLAGTVLTALVQSSTAITVLTVGFVNAGLMTLSQAVGIIYGANIGTTITAQLMALPFKLTDIALLVLGIGFAIRFAAKSRHWQDVGQAIMGFGMMFLGLKILNQGIPFIKNSPITSYFFETYANQPLLAVLIGMMATMLVHSSSATVGLTMVLGGAGLINLNGAIGLMLGDNIGTCVTAQLASLNTSTAGRRTAWAHTLYNVSGVLLALIIFPLFRALIQSTSSSISQQIANSHTLFNVLSAVLFLPITKYYVRFLERIVPEKRSKLAEGPASHLDPLLLESPMAALSAVMMAVRAATELTQQMLQQSRQVVESGDERGLQTVYDGEQQINEMQELVTKYLISLSQRQVGADISQRIAALLHSTNDVERIGDHLENFAELCKHLLDNNLQFTPQALGELTELVQLVNDMMLMISHRLGETGNLLEQEISQRESMVDSLAKRLRNNHISRLEAGLCQLQPGLVFLDMVSNLERIADHLQNIAECDAPDWEQNMASQEACATNIQ